MIPSGWWDGGNVDPMASPFFFQTGQGGDDTSTQNSYRDSIFSQVFAGVPGMEAFYRASPGGDDTSAAGINPELLQQYLQQNGYSLRSAAHGGGGRVWAEDANGGLIGSAQDYSNADPNFWTAALLAGAGVGAGVATGAIGGAGATGAATGGSVAGGSGLSMGGVSAGSGAAASSPYALTGAQFGSMGATGGLVGTGAGLGIGSAEAALAASGIGAGIGSSLPAVGASFLPGASSGAAAGAGAASGAGSGLGTLGTIEPAAVQQVASLPSMAQAGITQAVAPTLPEVASLAGSGLASLGSIPEVPAQVASLPTNAAAGITPAAPLSLPEVAALPAALPTTTPSATPYRPSDNYGEGMSGTQTGAYDAVVNATGSPGLANAAAGAASGVDALGEMFGPAASWIRQNPQLARMIFSGAGGLLGYMGAESGSGGGGGAQTFTGEPVQWTTGLQMGIQPQAQPWQQPALDIPGAIQARANNGAGRYFNRG
jgi:hypothetical protein